MSPLPATATPLLRPRSRSSGVMARQSGASNGVVMLKTPIAVRSRAFPLCRKMFYRATQSVGNDVETKVASDQGLVRMTACAVVDQLNSGEVTPLDLLDVLEQRIVEVDGKVNALPTLCFDRARTHAKALMKKAGRRSRPACGNADSDKRPVQCRGRAEQAGLADLQGYDRK